MIRLWLELWWCALVSITTRRILNTHHLERRASSAASAVTLGVVRASALSVVAVSALLVCGLSLLGATQSEGRTIVQIELADIVHPVTADYVSAGLARAEQIGASAVLIRLDTPGGLVDSMRAIVEDILSSEVPVIVWVGPSGVRAASAGFFILLAPDLAVMATGTNTGAAHPVSSFGGEIDEVMEQKVVSDVAAFLRSYTSQRGRNPELAELAVTESRSFTAEEAFDNELIDGVAGSVGKLIQMFDGQQIERFDGSMETLVLAGSTIESFQMTRRERLLSAIMNPNVALVLGMLGLVGLYLEITSPGMIFPGVIGGISLLLALFAFNLLPVNMTGVLLILLAIGLFVVEATVPSSGILAMGGIVSMIAGGLLLVDGPIPELRIQLPTLFSVTVPLAVITVFLVRLVFVSHRTKSVTGRSGMVGLVGTASSDIDAAGRVMVHGEYWQAHSQAPIPKGTRIRVVKMDGLDLEVTSENEEQE